MEYRFNTREELETYLKTHDLEGLDSEFSASSARLVERFGAKGVDFNRWWVFTATDWACPACNRVKADIVRLNQHGYVMGHLHEHHDHMVDFLEREFTRVSESRDVVVADEVAKKFVDRTAYALSAYDNTIVCSDCNYADGSAKRLIGAPKEFSFSPSEISQFVVPRANAEHELDHAAVQRVWQECRPVFEVRARLVRYLAELGAGDSHWYQPSSITAANVERRAKINMKYSGIEKIGGPDPEKLLYSTNKFEGEKSAWRVNRVVKSEEPPNESQIQHCINLNKRHWEATEGGWSCPVCKRGKMDVIRKSNKGVWTFLVQGSKVMYDPSSPKFWQYIKVCNDCGDAATHIGAEAESAARIKLSFSSALVSPSELAEVIRASPHRRHEIDNPGVDRLLGDITERIELGRFRA